MSAVNLFNIDMPTLNPLQPFQNVLPDADRVSTLLIKLGNDCSIWQYLNIGRGLNSSCLIFSSTSISCMSVIATKTLCYCYLYVTKW